MVRKISDDGLVYHEPPYTKEEQADFYGRIGNGAVTVVHPPPAPQPKPKPGAKRS